MRAALATGDDDDVAGELGDLLFAVVNAARHAGADAELALRRAAAKFRTRFAAVEALAASRGIDLAIGRPGRRSTRCGTRSSGTRRPDQRAAQLTIAGEHLPGFVGHRPPGVPPRPRDAEEDEEGDDDADADRLDHAAAVAERHARSPGSR